RNARTEEYVAGGGNRNAWQRAPLAVTNASSQAAISTLGEHWARCHDARHDEESHNDSFHARLLARRSREGEGGPCVRRRVCREFPGRSILRGTDSSKNWDSRLAIAIPESRIQNPEPRIPIGGRRETFDHRSRHTAARHRRDCRVRVWRRKGPGAASRSAGPRSRTAGTEPRTAGRHRPSGSAREIDTAAADHRAGPSADGAGTHHWRSRRRGEEFKRESVCIYP